MTPISAEEAYFGIANCGSNKYIQIGSLATCRVRMNEQVVLPLIIFAAVGWSLLIGYVLNDVINHEASGLFCASSGGEDGSLLGSTLLVGNGGAAEIWLE